MSIIERTFKLTIDVHGKGSLGDVTQINLIMDPGAEYILSLIHI